MTLSWKKGARFGIVALGAAAWLIPGAAMAVQPVSGSFPETAGDALSRNLKLIAESPHNVGAMIGAGKATLELGDAQAALTFFARAEQDAPRDGWVKKWEGSALVQLGQPAAALKFFRDAVSFGLPETAVAGDRGLAWDISGDPRRAQRDYRLALSQSADPEVTRRLALSLAISGERDQALQLLQEQLQRRDRAGFRTRALVLALTGDWQSADRDVEAELPAQQAAALEPFLARLPSLSLADRALAVHLGRFPGSGRAASPQTSYAQNSYSQNSYGRSAYAGLPPGYTPTPQPNAASAGARDADNSIDADEPEESAPGFGKSVAPLQPAPNAPRRIPGAQAQTSRPAPVPVRTASRSATPPGSTWSWSGGAQPAAPRTVAVNNMTQPAPSPRPAASVPPPSAPPQRPVEIADAHVTATPVVTQPVSHPATPPPPVATPTAAPPAAHSRLADVAAELDRIEEEQRARSAPAAAPAPAPTVSRASARTRAAAAAASARAARKALEAREPARHWVQLAHAADADVLPGEFARLKEKAPRLFASRLVWRAEADDTNRLLVGPFASEAEAESFVKRLSRSDVTGFAWSSDAGQKVEKLATR